MASPPQLRRSPGAHATASGYSLYISCCDRCPSQDRRPQLRQREHHGSADILIGALASDPSTKTCRHSVYIAKTLTGQPSASACVPEPVIRGAEEVNAAIPTWCSTECLDRCYSVEIVQHQRYIIKFTYADSVGVVFPYLPSQVEDAKRVFGVRIEEYSVVLWPSFSDYLDWMMSRQPWPPPTQLVLIILIVQLRPVPWPSFGYCVVALQLENFLLLTGVSIEILLYLEFLNGWHISGRSASSSCQVLNFSWSSSLHLYFKLIFSQYTSEAILVIGALGFLIWLTSFIVEIHSNAYDMLLLSSSFISWVDVCWLFFNYHHDPVKWKLSWVFMLSFSWPICQLYNKLMPLEQYRSGEFPSLPWPPPMQPNMQGAGVTGSCRVFSSYSADIWLERLWQRERFQWYLSQWITNSEAVSALDYLHGYFLYAEYDQLIQSNQSKIEYSRHWLQLWNKKATVDLLWSYHTAILFEMISIKCALPVVHQLWHCVCFFATAKHQLFLDIGLQTAAEQLKKLLLFMKHLLVLCSLYILLLVTYEQGCCLKLGKLPWLPLECKILHGRVTEVGENKKHSGA